MTDPHPSYDLTREPWIGCERLDGSRVLLGFEDVLVQAHELLSVHDESPLVTATVHRLLLACLHRVVDGPRSLAAWGTLWAQTRFDEDAVRAYFAKWRHRFDLFHPERPFLQCPGLYDALAAERQGRPPSTLPIRRLALEASTYAGAVHLLAHGGDDERATPASAARSLLGMLGFAAGGRIANTADSAPACPLRAGAVVLASGRTLRETLVLNLLVLREDRPLPAADDRPAWEADAACRYEKRAVRGWLDALTWQSRRVQLLREGAMVSGVVIAGGEQASSDWVEPMHALDVRDEKKGPMAIKFMPDRAGFRDALALYQAVAPLKGARRPMVCSQVAELIDEELLPASQPLDLLLLGVSSDQAAIRMWRAERLPLHGPLLVEKGRLDILRSALERVEAIEGALRSADYRLATCALDLGDRGPDKKDVGALVDRLAARPFYWNRVAQHFPRLAEQIARGDGEAAQSLFVAEAERAARAALRQAADQVGDGARAHRARALAESTLHRELEKLHPTAAAQE